MIVFEGICEAITGLIVWLALKGQLKLFSMAAILILPKASHIRTTIENFDWLMHVCCYSWKGEVECFHHFKHIFSFIFVWLYIILPTFHLKRWRVDFEVVPVNDATSHGIAKSQIVPSNSLRKELSNDIRFAYIVLTPVAGP